MDTFEKLHTTIDLDGLYDILEMQQVHGSWMAAAEKNAEEKAEQRRRIEELRRKR